MTAITYIKGDATCPQSKGVKIIAHICNDRGGWGKGFVLAISRRWKEPEQQYRDWYANRSKNDFALGAVQFVQVDKYIWLANMIAQHGTKTARSGVPIRYESVAECLETLAAKALELEASVHMPRIGCGLAGGNWDVIEPMIVAHLCDQGIRVVIYDFD